MKRKVRVKNPFGVVSRELDFPRTGAVFGEGAAPGDAPGWKLHRSAKG